MLPRYRVLTPILQKFLPSPGSCFSSLVMYPVVKKATGHSLWTVYISLCDYLSRDKSVQSSHLSWPALPAVAISAYGVGFVLILCCWQAVKSDWQARCVITYGTHASVSGDTCLAQVDLRWLKPREWMFFASCLRGSGLTDMSCLNKKLKGWSEIQLPSIPKVTGSSIPLASFGICGSGLGGRLQKQGCASHLPYAQCLTHELQGPLLAHACII